MQTFDPSHYNHQSPVSTNFVPIKRRGKKRTKKDRASSSPSKLLKMMKEAEQKFITPTPQKALGGQPGVTLVDVANSLGAQHSDLRRRVESKDLEYLNLLKPRFCIVI